MAHFALVENNIVTNVIVISDDDCAGGKFPASELAGQTFIANVLKKSGVWLQTSYNNNFRNIFAGYGYEYHSDVDIFINPKPFASWVRKKENQKFYWANPILPPDNEKDWYWNEEQLCWVEVNNGDN